MTSRWKSGLQIAIASAILLAGLRVFLIYRSRNEATNVTNNNQPLLRREMQADDYVVPTKSHAYDLESARELIGKQVWAKNVKDWQVYPCDGHKAYLTKPVGSLTPLEHFEIAEVISQTDPRANRG